MHGLPAAPQESLHRQVRVRFVEMTPGDPDRGFVPGYRFRIHDLSGHEVGHLHFRVGDTGHVRMAAGHIGFGILAEHRGHGYAGQACIALAPWISTVSPSVIITADPDNLPSIRTILRIGGIFMDEIAVPEGDPHFLRGSLRKRRYRWHPGEIPAAPPA